MLQLLRQHVLRVLLLAVLCGRLLLVRQRWRFRAALLSQAAVSTTMSWMILLLRWLRWSMTWLHS
jgi:hypothetical protein